MEFRTIFSIVLIITLESINYGLCSEACSKPKIAIIGAGIGGASTAHFLTELFQDNLEIDIFETNTVGGRLATIKLGNDEFEAGGAIIHPRNKYMRDFVKLLNLQERPPVGGAFGIWNGKEFVFEESSYETVTVLKLLYRYGLEPIYLHRYVTKILDEFEKIYDLQDKGVGFENVTALLGAMHEGFVDLLQISIKKHLADGGYGSRLIDELVEATLVVNYGQDTDVQAFVSCVSVAGAGFDLWSVKGGNKMVPTKLIAKNSKISTLQLSQTVTKIRRLSEEGQTQYEVFYTDGANSDVKSKVYDIVVIAAPMTSDHTSPIVFDGFEDSNIKFSGAYQTTIATFVRGNVNSSYFGLKEELGGILSCDPVETIISSIGELSSVEGKKNDQTRVWKIFSREKLADSVLNQMFEQIDEMKEIIWKAYPKYTSTLRNDKFKLDHSLYHVNAIEWAASAMEMSAIGGRNVAILAFNDYQKKCSSTGGSHHSGDKTTGTHSPEL